MTEPTQYKFGLVIRNDDYIVRDHRVHQVRIMPGVTFMDMILRAIQTKGFAPEQVELRNMLFKEPVATSEAYDRKVQITVEPAGTHWTIRGRSQKIAGGRPLSAQWDENLQGELHPRADKLSGAIDIDALKRRSRSKLDMDEAYAFTRRIEINHYEFMKGLGSIYDCGDGLLAEIHLSDLASRHLRDFYLHPVYLDASTLVQAVFVTKHLRAAQIEDTEIQPFIPMFVESFRAADRLNETCYVYVQEKAITVAPSRDVMYSDIELYNEQGQIVASFRRIMQKRIRFKQLIQNLQNLQPSEAVPQMQPVPAAQVVEQAPAQVVRPVSEGEASQDQIEQHLRQMVGQMLHKQPAAVDLDDGFYDQGLDSGNLLRLVQNLEQQLGRELYPTLLFEYSNIRQLAAYLRTEFGDAFAATTVAAPMAPPVAAEPLASIVQLDLRQMVGGMLNKRPEEVSVEDGFYDQGLDSGSLLRLVQKLEEKLGQQLYPTLLFEYTNIHQLADYLAREYEAAYRAQVPREDLAAPCQAEPAATLYFRRVMEKADLGVAFPVARLSAPVLLLDEDESLRNELSARLGPSVPVVLAKPGAAFRALSDRVYELNPGQPDQYRQLVDSLGNAGLLPGNILHRWAKAPFVTAEPALAGQLERSIYSVLYLTQSLMAHKPKDKVRLLFAYTDGQEGQPVYAALSGFQRVLKMESPKFLYKTLELCSAETASTLADVALREWQAETEADAEVRYADGHRWTGRLTEIAPAAESNNSVPLKDRGTYLITGGAGGLGLLFARYLAERVRARIVLTGRSALSAEKLKQLQQLEALGAEILYLQADVSERAQVERLVEAAKAKFTTIDGVFHSAGILCDTLVPTKTKAEMDGVLAPKVQGTLNLDEALRDEPLDFVVYFSSIAAMLGNAGQADYAYANRFLDHYAAYREALRRQGLRKGRTLSINWPLWQAGGMRMDKQSEEQLRLRMGVIAMLTQSGLQAFEAAFRQNGSQVLVIEGDKARIRQGLGLAPAPQPPVAAAPVSRQAGVAEDAIAIVGLAGRYPKAHNTREFWRNLQGGRDCITEIPAERWDHSKLYDPDRTKPGKCYAKWGGFVDDVDKFDPLFFNIPALQADYMDPQERLFLETVWETVEDAGYTRQTLARKRVGVFVGVMWSHYQLFAAEETLKGNVQATSSVSASIANRVSYHFNFRGPSIALDTMCSSSLTSLHLACESIRRGECDLAIAGGVNLTLHVSKYLVLSTGNFASSDGRCRAFGEGGDGYVPGEGVGAVLLKPLSKAEADGDQIYAIVKASAVNHGGKASGFYVPNPNEQSNVIEGALKTANVHPRTVTYVEAHGTGTALGDPIEISGLTRAFSHVADKQFCAIGSVKSNIGHLESAAGIASISKVLLQLKHKQLVPSLHAEELNHEIDFANSPFYVQRELAAWTQPVLIENGVSKTYPRRAGISSFGAGGANAHVILEEYVPTHIHAAISEEPVVIVLSARNREQLLAQAHQLQAYVDEQLRDAPDPVRLADLAFTLQVGRLAMEERLALVASSLQELSDLLSRYLQGQPALPNLFAGNIRQGRDKASGREGEEQFRAILRENQLNKLAQFWVNGADIDWGLLYPNGGVRRVSLPTYPFAKERCWLPVTAEPLAQGSAKLHPLLHQNTSTLKEQRYTTRFTGHEFFFCDHVIFGQRMLPGVTYLEMARAAAELAGEAPVRTIRNVVWAAPVVMDGDSLDVHISLFPLQQQVDFEVYTAGAGGQRIVHSSGSLEYVAERSPAPAPEVFDIAATRQRCPRQTSGDTCYQKFAEAGFAYGPTFRSIQQLYSNETEAVSQVVLPGELAAEFADFRLHPAILDAALQTVAGLMDLRKAESGFLPFSVGEVELLGPVPKLAYVHVTLAEMVTPGAPLLKFRIHVTNSEGEVLVRLNDFAVKSIRQAATGFASDPASATDEQAALMAVLQQVASGQLDAEEADRWMEERM